MNNFEKLIMLNRLEGKVTKVVTKRYTTYTYGYVKVMVVNATKEVRGNVSELFDRVINGRNSQVDEIVNKLMAENRKAIAVNKATGEETRVKVVSVDPLKGRVWHSEYRLLRVTPAETMEVKVTGKGNHQVNLVTNDELLKVW